MMVVLIILACLMLVVIGIGIGYWFAQMREIYDIRWEVSFLSARVSKLQDLVDYYEEKEPKYKDDDANENEEYFQFGYTK